jgi:hypothetical protein
MDLIPTEVPFPLFSKVKAKIKEDKDTIRLNFLQYADIDKGEEIINPLPAPILNKKNEPIEVECERVYTKPISYVPANNKEIF